MKNGFFLVGVASGLLWGFNDVSTSMVSQHLFLSSLLTSMTFALCLALLQDASSACAIVGVSALRKSWLTQWRASRSVRWTIVLSALFSGPFGLVCSILAISYVGAVYAGAITAAFPLVTMVGAKCYLKESISVKRLCGMLLGVTAVMAIGLMGAHRHGSHVVLGLMFAFLSMLGWGVESLFFSKAYSQTGMNSSSILALRQMFSSFFYAVVLIVMLFLDPHELNLFHQVLRQPLLLMCICSAGLSYLAYYFSIKNLTASVATLFNITFLFWSAVISVCLGLVILSWWFWCWACLLFLGLIISFRN